MQKSKIEWTDYSINPVKGLCPMACSYCYARRMYKRFKWDREIRFDQLAFTKLPSSGKVFVGSTMELLGNWVEPEWLETIFHICANRTDNTFIFLTKQPQNLIKWSPFPDNCWVGVSVDNETRYREALNYLPNIKAKVRFASFEPLLTRMPSEGLINFLDWVIVGQQTPISIETTPETEWVEEIIVTADHANIPVFLKNNLWNNACIYEGEQGILFNEHGTMRQEYPRL